MDTKFEQCLILEEEERNMEVQPTVIAPVQTKRIGNLLGDLNKASELSFDGRWKNWAKRIDSVDTKQSNGYCFVGPFVKDGTVEYDIKASLYLVAAQTGSNKYRTMHYVVVAMASDGTLSKLDIATSDSAAGWALRIRDAVASKLNEITSTTPADTNGHALKAKLQAMILMASDEQIEAIAKILAA